MTRNKKPRFVDFEPKVTYFKPRGVFLSSLEEVELNIDELEAIRLVNLENLDQVRGAEKMNISQSTFQRILKQAYKKITEALVKGKAIKVKGGEIVMRGMGRGFGQGRGLGQGRGRGRMGGPLAGGPGGTCVCTNPQCKHTIPHQVGVACFNLKCPKCGSPMTRQG